MLKLVPKWDKCINLLVETVEKQRQFGRTDE
jgi:hypothetical protein